MTQYQITIDVWRQYNVDHAYTISLCDDDGEIECLGGADDPDEAFAEACELADERGVPARLMIGETDQVDREYVPAEVAP